MNKISEQVKENYDIIAEFFSHTRHRPWREMEGLRDLVKSGNVIDLGCGNGRLFELFKDNKKIKYLGIDFSPKMIGVAKKRYLHPPIGVAKAKFKVGDLTCYILPATCYNAIFLIASYHHIPDKKLRFQTLENVKKALKDDGVVVLTVWNLFHKKTMRKVRQSWKRKLLGKERGGIFDIYYPFNDNGNIVYRYYRMFTPRGIKKELRKAGFEIFCEERWAKGQNLAFFCRKK